MAIALGMRKTDANLRVGILLFWTLDIMKKAFLFSNIFLLGVSAALIAPRIMSMMTGQHMGHHMGNHMDTTYDPSAHHGAGQPKHDEVNMPMLNGTNTTDAEVAELRDMFQNHQEITRTVELITNGIKTTTETLNPDLRASLVSHVVGMIDRVEDLNDPEIPIQSPTLAVLFEKGNQIVTEITPTDRGVIVTQTSDDPELVTALQTHAGEVSDLAKRGMQAVHEQMMKQHH